MKIPSVVSQGNKRPSHLSFPLCRRVKQKSFGTKPGRATHELSDFGISGPLFNLGEGIKYSISQLFFLMDLRINLGKKICDFKKGKEFSTLERAAVASFSYPTGRVLCNYAHTHPPPGISNPPPLISS
jgi:hypothetical protein